MSELVQQVVALTDTSDRAAVARDLARRLGGTDFIVFLRDEAVDALLPAPGFPQTLHRARAWRSFLEDCLAQGELASDGLTVRSSDGPGPAYGVACGPDVVGVVLGTSQRSVETAELRSLLPILAASFRGERAATHAKVQAGLARQAATHAEGLATALDGARRQLEQALRAAERGREEVELANEQLQAQAMELETQAEELTAQADRLQEMNDALEVARDSADEANRAKSDFLATMSHELRTPLNAIGGHLQLIQLGIYGPVAPEQRDALERIDRNQRHLLALINDVLNFARLEAGRLEYQLEPLGIGDVIDDLKPMIEPQILARKQRYTVLDCDGALRVLADREKLQQILLNLLSNAVKFTGEGGSITIDCEPAAHPGSVVAISVRDSGIGIPADKFEHIFEPFVQVDAKHSREGHGAGLGLAISRDLARGMGGDIAVESDLGAGTCFRLTLPKAG